MRVLYVQPAWSKMRTGKIKVHWSQSQALSHGPHHKDKPHLWFRNTSILKQNRSSSSVLSHVRFFWGQLAPKMSICRLDKIRSEQHGETFHLQVENKAVLSFGSLIRSTEFLLPNTTLDPLIIHHHIGTHEAPEPSMLTFRWGDQIFQNSRLKKTKDSALCCFGFMTWTHRNSSPTNLALGRV